MNVGTRMVSVLLLVIYMMPMPVYAVEINDLAVCRAMATNELRLDCYDDVVKNITGKSPNQEKSLKPLTPQQRLSIEKSDFGAWVVEDDWIQPGEGIIVKTAYLNANDEVDTGLNGVIRPSLVWQCHNNKLRGFIRWKTYLGSSTARVTTEFNNSSPKSRDWPISSQGKSSFYPRGQLDRLRNGLWNGNVLIASVKPSGLSRITATFELQGVRAVIRMFNHCR